MDVVAHKFEILHRRDLLAGFVCAVLAPWPVCAACPAETAYSDLAGTAFVDLATRPASLIAVSQSAADFTVYVDSNSPFWTNNPGDRNSTDYLLLERAVHGPEVTLCIYPVFAHGAPGEFSIVELALDESDTNRIDTLRTLNTAGALWQAGTAPGIEQAGALYAALEQVELPGEHQFEFDMRLFATLASVRLTRYADAIPGLQALIAEHSDHPDMYKVHFQLGKVYVRQRNIDEAIAHFTQARSLLDSADATALAWLRYERGEIGSWLGEAWVHDGDLDAADATLDQAIDDAAPDFALLGRIFDNKGLVGIRRGEVAGITKEEQARWYERSTEDHLRGLYFSQAAGDRETLQVTENNIAIHYARTGERRKSIVHFLNVLRMLDEVDNPEWRALLFGNLSNYLQILGDYSKALAYLRQSLEAASPDANERYAAYICRIGTLLDLLGDAVAAVSEHERCLQLATQLGDQATQVDARLLLSRRLLLQGDQVAAAAVFQPGLELLTSLDNFQLRKRARTHQARLLLAADRPADADAVLAEALAVDLNAQYPNETIEALELAMRIQLALGQEDEAFASGERAMAMIEALHTQLEAERIGPAWNGQSSRLYETVAATYLDRYRNTADANALRVAFHTMERSRDISLRQRLSAGLPNDSTTLEEEKRLALYSDIASLLAQSGAQEPLPRMNDLAYYHQHDLLSLARLNDVDTIAVPESLQLEQIQQRLAVDQLVLYYVVADAQLHVFVITADDFALAQSMPMGEVEQALAEAGETLKSPNPASIALLRRLSGLLLPDLGAYSAATDILLVPHTGLHAVPFAALTRAADGAPYTPLVATYTLTTLPSLSAYFMDKPQRAMEYSTGVAILADPVFDVLQLAAVEPPADVVASAWRGWSDNLQPLPYTAREAVNIATQFPGRTLTYTGAAANRRNLSNAQTRNAKVLHIATHGYFDSMSADNVGLALSTIDDAGNADPGFITLTELFSYAFNNQLVVISGCETALGKEQAGVGFNGLTRGFLAQGVRHVISTLWPVSDRATAEFMRLFYRHLDATKDVAASLRLAQQELGKNPDYRNPYYWAGFVLTSIDPDATVDLSQ